MHGRDACIAVGVLLVVLVRAVEGERIINSVVPIGTGADRA